MSEANEISVTEIIQYLKLSCRMPHILQEIQARKIVKDTAKANNIIIETEELQQAADFLRRQNNLLDSTKTLEWMNHQRLERADFEEMIYYNVLYHKVFWALVSDSIEPYFYQHQLDYLGAIIYEIVLDNYNLAMELFYGIQEGEFSFWDAAHQHITDLELRRRGGYRGFIRRKDLKPQLSAAVFAANPPQILKPIQVNQKTHLIFVEEIIQPKLDETMETEIAEELFDRWLESQLK